MSKHDVEQLEDILPGLDVKVVGEYDEYFVVDDGQFRWTGYCADVTQKVLRRVQKAEELFRKYEEQRTYTGYDELCNRVDYIDDEEILAKVKALYGEAVSTV